MMWCDDPPEDRVISIVAGCLANHDRAHSHLQAELKRPLYARPPKGLMSVLQKEIINIV